VCYPALEISGFAKSGAPKQRHRRQRNPMTALTSTSIFAAGSTVVPATNASGFTSTFPYEAFEPMVNVGGVPTRLMNPLQNHAPATLAHFDSLPAR